MKAAFLLIGVLVSASMTEASSVRRIKNNFKAILKHHHIFYPKAVGTTTGATTTAATTTTATTTTTTTTVATTTATTTAAPTTAATTTVATTTAATTTGTINN